MKIVTGIPEIDEVLAKPEVVNAVKTAFETEAEVLTSGLKTKNTELLTENVELKKIKSFVVENGGVDELKVKLAANTGNKDADIEALRKAHKEQVSALNKQTKTLQDKLLQRDFDAKLQQEISAAGGVVELLLPAMKNRTKAVVGEDGEVKIEVFAPNSNIMLNKSGENATLVDLVEEFKQSPVFAVAFKGNGSKGAGFNESRSVETSGIVNPFKKETFSLSEQSKIFKENSELAKQLATEANYKLG